ncbi:MAG: hypothetical protein ACRYFR_15065 [Janthinobacterium lividum]
MKPAPTHSANSPAKQPRAAKFWPVVGFATLTGMRGASTPALLSHFLVRHPARKLQSSPLRLFQKPALATVFKLMAAGEFVADKLPNTPNRTAPLGLAGRAATGALVGATWYKASGGSALGGAAVGALGAVAATFLTLWLRVGISQKTDTPVALVGVGEDALVWSAGAILLNSLTPPKAPAAKRA